jgi:Flp pilus assembly protein TadB
VNRLRLAFALAGFALALLSVALDDRRLAWGAIGLLAASLLLRLLLRRRNRAKLDRDA